MCYYGYYSVFVVVVVLNIAQICHGGMQELNIYVNQSDGVTIIVIPFIILSNLLNLLIMDYTFDAFSTSIQVEELTNLDELLTPELNELINS